jgi:hypothetical protein
MHKGWIIVSENLRKGIPNGAYIKLMVGNKKIFCQVRGTPGKNGRVEINEWYRNELGWTDPPDEAELVINQVGLLGRIRAWSSHPEDIVRVGVGLGMISVGLGLLSVVLALTPSSILRLTSSSLSTFRWGIAGLVVSLIFTIILVYLLCAGLSTLFRKPPKLKEE